MTDVSKTPPVPDGALESSVPDAGLDAVDRKILDLIQSGFPLEPRPYAVIGACVGVGEEEALERVRRLRERGVIRRIGANFQSGKVGFHSTLCAARVPEDKLEAFIAAVNAEPGVTHNYLRANAYNVWFTCIGPSTEAIGRALDRIRAATGIAVLNLPAERLYKIKVDFRMDAD